MAVTKCGPLPPEEIKRRLVRLTLPAASGKFRLPVLPWEMNAARRSSGLAEDGHGTPSSSELWGKAYGSE